jgi:hypothetical protein
MAQLAAPVLFVATVLPLSPAHAILFAPSACGL